MKIADVMTRDVSVCLPHEPLIRAARIMWDMDCGCVPVIDGDAHPLGMITDRDVCMSASLMGGRMYSAVEHVMSRPVWSCRDDDDVSRARLLMQEHQLRRLPVVDADGRLVGLVSISDIVCAVRTLPEADRTGQAGDVLTTLAEIARPRCELKFKGSYADLLV